MGLSPAAANQDWTGGRAGADRYSRSRRPAAPANDPYFLEVNHELSDKGFFVRDRRPDHLRVRGR